MPAVLTEVLDGNVEKLGYFLHPIFIGGSHPAFPGGPLLRGDAEAFGALFASAAAREFFHPAFSDVTRDGLAQLIRYFAHILLSNY